MNFVNKVVFKQETGGPLNERSIFWINIPIVWLGFPIIVALSTYSVDVGMWIIYLSLTNGLFHVLVGLRLRLYNPGLVISLFLNIPLSIYTLVKLPELANISSLSHGIGIAIAIIVQISLIVFVVRNIKKRVIE